MRVQSMGIPHPDRRTGSGRCGPAEAGGIPRWPAAPPGRPRTIAGLRPLKKSRSPPRTPGGSRGGFPGSDPVRPRACPGAWRHFRPRACPRGLAAFALLRVLQDRSRSSAEAVEPPGRARWRKFSATCVRTWRRRGIGARGPGRNTTGRPRRETSTSLSANEAVEIDPFKP